MEISVLKIVYMVMNISSDLALHWTKTRIKIDVAELEISYFLFSAFNRIVSHQNPIGRGGIIPFEPVKDI